MKAADIIRYQPWLRFCDVNSISTRLLEQTGGNAFVVYNVIHNRYELHTVRAFRYNGESLNAVVEDLNQFLIRDFRANDITRFGDEVESRRDFVNQLYDVHEEKRLESLTSLGLSRIEKLIGRDL